MKIFDLCLLGFAAALALPATASAEPALRGDAVRGAQLYRMECSACHGNDLRGVTSWAKLAGDKGLGQLPDLRDAAFLAVRSDTQLRSAIRKGTGRNGEIPGHAFSPALSTLDVWDLVQYLRDGVLTVGDLYPDAAKFTAKEFAIDVHGQARLREGAGVTLTPEDAKVVVLTIYRGAQANGEAQLVPWKPVNLDLLKADDRLGFLVFEEVLLPGETEKAGMGLAIGRDGKIKRIVLMMDDAKRRAEHEKLLSSYVGLGERKPVKLKAPRNVRGAEKYETLVTRALARAAEGIAAYDKSERERTMFD